ncbi:MAG: tetraacyldisaccharide 4'-kinase [Rhizobiaceae bacterium]
MVSEAPPFWWKKADWRAAMLSPFSSAYASLARRNLLNARREKVSAPVLCVGNLTVGGAGKTPVAIALAVEAREMGLKPGFLSRGHGGSHSAPHLVDPAHDRARHVGDEPLLLARHAPVAVTRNRAAGARLLIEKGCDFLILDDGFQSARVHFDYALIVVDARRGVGNGHTMPGGPLRARLVDQMPYADAVLAVGDGNGADPIVRMAARAGKPVFSARQRPLAGSGIAGKRVLAFAGIGDPAKFFATVEEAGGEVAMKRAFADHHIYASDELADLAATAARRGLELATTAKDAARIMDGSAAAKKFLENLHVVEIDMVFDPETIPRQIIGAALDAWRERRLER